MQAKITRSFLAALSLIGVLTLPSAASAHDEDDYSDDRGSVQREFHQPSSVDREDFYFPHVPRWDQRDYYGRYSYNDNDDYYGNRWYDGQRRHGNQYYQGKHCKLQRQSDGNSRQYRPRHDGNDYYGDDDDGDAR